MGAFSLWQWLVVLAVVLILFARPGKISGIMGDFGKGLKSFKKGMKDEDSSINSEVTENTSHIENVEENAAVEKTVREKAPASNATPKKKAAKKKAAKKKVAKKKAAKK